MRKPLKNFRISAQGVLQVPNNNLKLVLSRGCLW